MTSKWAKGSGGPSGSECGNLVEVAAPMLVRIREGKEGGGKGPLVSEDQSLTPATGNDQVLAFAQNTRDEVRLQGGDGDICGTLAAEPGMKQTTYAKVGMQVRRLTPVECCRLQGFPDDYLTQVTFRGKCPPADRVMYKALGNSWAVPCARYIGQRIAEIISTSAPTTRP